jgi:hypothetical protein
MKLPFVRSARVALAIAAAAAAIPLSILVLPRGGNVRVVAPPGPAAQADHVRALEQRSQATAVAAAARPVSPTTAAEPRTFSSRPAARRARARQGPAPVPSVPAPQAAPSPQQTQVPPAPRPVTRSWHGHGRGHAPGTHGQSVGKTSQVGRQAAKPARGRHRRAAEGHARPPAHAQPPGHEQGKHAGGPGKGPPKGGRR